MPPTRATGSPTPKTPRSAACSRIAASPTARGTARWWPGHHRCTGPQRIGMAAPRTACASRRCGCWAKCGGTTPTSSPALLGGGRRGAGRATNPTPARVLNMEPGQRGLVLAVAYRTVMSMTRAPYNAVAVAAAYGNGSTGHAAPPATAPGDRGGRSCARAPGEATRPGPAGSPSSPAGQPASTSPTAAPPESHPHHHQHRHAAPQCRRRHPYRQLQHQRRHQLRRAHRRRRRRRDAGGSAGAHAHRGDQHAREARRGPHPGRRQRPGRPDRSRAAARRTASTRISATAPPRYCGAGMRMWRPRAGGAR